MHFSRNPPGPNTSLIEGFADSLASASAASSGAFPAAVGSSSIGRYSRWAVFAARFTLATGDSPAELDMRLARNPPLFSPAEIKSPVTIAYPSSVLAASSRRHETPWRNSLLTSHLALERAKRFLQCIPLLANVEFNLNF